MTDNDTSLAPPRPGNYSRTTVQGIENADRIHRVMELRKSGYGYPEIARRLGYADESGPRNVVKRQLHAMRHEDVEEMRELISARYDDLLRALWVRAKQGDLGVIDRVLRLEEQRAKLLGLNSPMSVAHEFDFSKWTPEQIQFWLRTGRVPTGVETLTMAAGAATSIIEGEAWSHDPMAPQDTGIDDDPMSPRMEPEADY